MARIEVTPIPDAGYNPDIIDFARWAVEEYNRVHQTSLKFMRVFFAGQEIPSDGPERSYTITLEAVKNFLNIGEYKAEVRVQPNAKKLVGFTNIIPPA
ncbi:hypothetical protein BUALT_Bualt02G0168300 [Buddleja alternifolia]|uniref:Uncharacterized protein n=1 Tax=Buddleja alternifolia TaxID=168488 RepID=A0AAV6Y235_9LAMI|nr:hypothetical protein BUALT_Bualt02G0168300 [Buddleja alternifolia]